MIKRFRLMAAAALALSCAYPALAAEPTGSDAAQEIQALKTRIEQLEARQKAAEQAQQAALSQHEQAATSDALTQDAVRHDEFLSPEGFTAGYSDGRFVIQSSDKNFTFRPWMHFQFREVVNYRKDIDLLNKKEKKYGDEVDDGFEVRRMRFGFDGNIFSPDITYFFNWGTQRTSANATVSGATPSTTGGKATVTNSLGGSPLLEEAWLKYHIPTTPFYIKAGQIKDVVVHDQIVSSRYQHSAEHSLTTDIFTNGDDFTQAVTFIYDPKSDLRTETGISHGMRSANTNFQDYPDNGSYNAYDYGIIGRVEYKFFGKWDDYSQVGAVGVKQPLLVVGAGGDYSERGRAGQLVAAADVQYADQNGLLIYSAFVDRYTTHNFGYYSPSSTGASITAAPTGISGHATNEYSLLFEAGYMFNNSIEPFARYELMRLGGDAIGSHNSIQCITAGLNDYLYGHRLKLTAEAIWLPEGLPYDDSSNDVFANTNGKTELTFEVQVQLLI